MSIVQKLPIVPNFRLRPLVTLAAITLLLIAAPVLAPAANADDRDFCLAAHAEDNLDACTRAIDAGTAQGRDLAALYLSRGIAHMQRFELNEAVNDINQAIRLDPASAAARDARGRVYGLVPDRAIVDYDAAIALDPTYARAYAHRGAAYRLKGEPEPAIADLNEAIRLDPGNAQAYVDRGLAFAQQGNADRALADFNEAIRLDPQDRFAYLDRGQTYQHNGDLDHALADYDQVIRLRPFIRIYEVRGSAYQAKGDLDRAIADYSEAIRRSPDDALAYEARGLAKQAQGDSAGASADLAKAKRLTTILGLPIPTVTKLHAVLGLLALFSGGVVLLGMMTAKRYPRWTALFFVTMGLTDAGGVLLQDTRLVATVPLGLSLGLLAVAAFAFYGRRAARRWRWTFIIATIAALYLNVFIATEQAFLSLPFLMRLLPLDPAPVFLFGPVAGLALFVVLGIFALRQYHPQSAALAA